MTRRDFLYACGIIVLPQLPEQLFVRIGLDFGNPPAFIGWNVLEDEPISREELEALVSLPKGWA